MAGLGVKLVGLTRILARFQAKALNKDFTPALKLASLVLIRSVGLNFAQGGRPTGWAISQRAQEQSGRTLRDTGVLAAAVGASGTRSARAQKGKTSKYDGKAHSATGINRVEPLRLTFGVSCPYAAPMQFGFRNKHRGGVFVPGRPFLMIQPEDRQKIIDLLTKMVTK